MLRYFSSELFAMILKSPDESLAYQFDGQLMFAVSWVSADEQISQFHKSEDLATYLRVMNLAVISMALLYCEYALVFHAVEEL